MVDFKIINFFYRQLLKCVVQLKIHMHYVVHFQPTMNFILTSFLIVGASQIRKSPTIVKQLKVCNLKPPTKWMRGAIIGYSSFARFNFFESVFVSLQYSRLEWIAFSAVF